MGLCKKKKSLSEEDFEKEYGRHWIWASLDPESKLIINFFIGQRTLENCRTFVHDLLSRIRTKPLFTSDELPHYETVLVENFSCLEEQPKTGKRGRPKKPKPVIDPELKYATVHKVRQNGKVVKVERNIVFGKPESIEEIIASSKVSKKINTSFIERANLTLRNYNKKLARKTLCFAKQKRALEAQANIAVTYYNFSRPNRGLTLRGPNGTRLKRTPAMAADLIDR
ncbi:MAG: IS1 family transposase, partial [Planctomycetota bacterium]